MLKFVWEKQDKSCGGKLNKSLLKNTLENSPFDMKVLALKQVEKNTKRDGKNWLWNPLEILYKTGQGNPIL